MLKYLIAGLLMLGLVANATEAQTLKIGDKAPPLSGGEFVQGEAVSEFENGKVYVVEMWATWCGPCIAAIPHVNDLQKKYEDDGLVIIGQNIWENQVDRVKPFVEKMGEKMTYRVAFDKDNHMAEKWMEAAGQNGIPCSFIIDREGAIAWIGHPMSMDAPLEGVIKGTYDAKEEAKKAEEFTKLQEELGQAMQAGDMDKAMGLFDKAAELRPELKDGIVATKFNIFAQQGKYDEAYKAVEGEIAGMKDEMALNQIAWTIVMPDSPIEDKNYDVALKAAERANELTEGKDAAILDTLARAHFRKGNTAKAIEFQKKAIDNADDEMKSELEAALKEYESQPG